MRCARLFMIIFHIFWSLFCLYFYHRWFYFMVTVLSVFLWLMVFPSGHDNICISTAGVFFYSGHGIVCISTTGSFISGHDITCISTTDGFVFWLRYCQYFLDWCFFFFYCHLVLLSLNNFSLANTTFDVL